MATGLPARRVQCGVVHALDWDAANLALGPKRADAMHAGSARPLVSIVPPPWAHHPATTVPYQVPYVTSDAGR